MELIKLKLEKRGSQPIKKRDDSDLYDYLASIANSENCKIKVHKNCRQDYTNKRHSIDLSDKGEDKSPPKGYGHMLHNLIGKQNVFFVLKLLTNVTQRFLLGQQVFFHLRVLSSNSVENVEMNGQQK